MKTDIRHSCEKKAKKKLITSLAKNRKEFYFGH